MQNTAGLRTACTTAIEWCRVVKRHGRLARRQVVASVHRYDNRYSDKCEGATFPANSKSLPARAVESSAPLPRRPPHPALSAPRARRPWRKPAPFLGPSRTFHLLAKELDTLHAAGLQTGRRLTQRPAVLRRTCDDDRSVKQWDALEPQDLLARAVSTQRDHAEGAASDCAHSHGPQVQDARCSTRDANRMPIKRKCYSKLRKGMCGVVAPARPTLGHVQLPEQVVVTT